MAKYLIEGGHELSGEIRVSGNKNSVLPLMAAGILFDEPLRLTNMPKIRDVEAMAKLLRVVGCKIEGLGTRRLTIDGLGAKTFRLPDELVAVLRASIILMGPLLIRFGKFQMRHPGGDIIGKRPVGTHFEAVESFGGEVRIKNSDYQGSLVFSQSAIIKGNRKNEIREVFLDEKSVTATENALLLAVKAPGTTLIENAACEPHIQELTCLLQKAGGKIEGAGTNTIKVIGVKRLKSVVHRVWPDYVEAGTFAILGALQAKSLKISPVRLQDLKMVLLYLKRMGVDFKAEGRSLLIRKSELKVLREKQTGTPNFQVMPWPGFPPDLMSPFIVLATQTKGVVLCQDWMYESRMFFVDKLIKMGANITICDPHRVLIYGPTKLSGKELTSPDIRAGIALVIAALTAGGKSEIDNIELIERGYEDLEKRLQKIGARIKQYD